MHNPSFREISVKEQRNFQRVKNVNEIGGLINSSFCMRQEIEANNSARERERARKRNGTDGNSIFLCLISFDKK